MNSLLLFLFLILTKTKNAFNIWDDLNLPDKHIPYYFYRNQNIKQLCFNDSSCPYKEYASDAKCYGYEKNCKAIAVLCALY